jgi:hypothetical protein
MYESLAAHEQKVPTADQVKHDDLTEALAAFQTQLTEVSCASCSRQFEFTSGPSAGTSLFVLQDAGQGSDKVQLPGCVTCAASGPVLGLMCCCVMNLDMLAGQGVHC